MSRAIAAMKAAKKGMKGALFTQRRFFSAPWKESPCYIVGMTKTLEVSAARCLPLKDWFKLHPFMEEIPDHRLITIDPSRPYQFNDDNGGNRHLMWTACIHSDNCKRRGIPLDGAFSDGNVYVVPELNVLAFKHVPAEDTSSTPPSPGFFEVVDFMQRLVSEEQNSTLDQFPMEWDTLLQGMSDPNIPTSWILYHSAFFSDEEIAMLYIELHRLLRHQMMTRGQNVVASDILAELDKEYPDIFCVAKCQNHFLLKHLMGVHGATKKPKSSSNPAWSAVVPGMLQPLPIPHPKGSAVVDVNRIAVIHCIERQLYDKVVMASANSRTKVPAVLGSYLRDEVIRLLRYIFPCYVQLTLDEFNSRNLLPLLRLERRKPIPSIYKM